MSERRSGSIGGIVAVVVCLVLVMAGAGVALADWQQGKIHFKDGRKLEGAIEDRGGQVALKGRFGETLFDRKEIDRIEYSGGESPDGADAAEPEHGLWLLRLKDGRQLRAERFLDKGTSVIVVVGGVEFTISKQEIEDIKNLETGGGKAPSVEEAWDPNVYQDIAAGFVITAPNPDWRIEREPREPLVRVEMVNDSLDARVGVRVFPVSEELAQFREVSEETAEVWANKLAIEIKALYGTGGKPSAEIVPFQGVNVYQFDYRANEVVSKTGFRFVELRFFQEDLLFIIYARAPTKKFDDVMFEKLRWAQQAFARLGSLLFTPRLYVDRVLGYQLRVDQGPWTFDLALFDDDHPVRFVLPESDAANVTVGLELRSGTGDAAGWINEMVSLRQQKPNSYFKLKNDGVRTREVGSAQVATVEFEDFPDRETKLEDFRSTVVAVGDVLVHLHTRVSQSDEAKVSRGLVANLHANLVPVGITQLVEQTEWQRAAQQQYIDGLEAWREKRFEEAIVYLQGAVQNFTGYVSALRLASRVARDAKRYSEALDFLAKAEDIEPREGSQQEKRALLKDAFNHAKKEKKFKEAIAYLRDSLRLGDPDGKGRAEVEKVFLEWARTLTSAKKFKEASKVFDDALKETRNSQKVQDEYVKMLTGWANLLVREQKFRDAKRAAKRAGRINRDPKNLERVQKLLETIAKAEEKAREG